ncbi:MAG TPA: outer membrane beta-barrel domain-containing protein [Myxococcales bacterium]|nr:outer membrane beta-barrel domain-containing protein [Myxococcales bacterium]
MKEWIVSAALLLPAVALAQAEELENPGRVAAVQERVYRMNQELSLGIGTLPLDAFYKGFGPQVTYTFHFSDTFAWQIGRGMYSYPATTSLRQQLERDFGVLPTAFEVVQWMAGSDLVWSPIYGKTSFLNQQVLHFEAYASIGGTLIKTNSQFRPALDLGVGVRVFSSKFVSYRLDVTNNVCIPLKFPVVNVLNVPTVVLSVALNFGSPE